MISDSLGNPIDECGLRLMSTVNDVRGLPREGKNLIVVAAIRNGLHFRIFDLDGKIAVDSDERRLTEKAQPIQVLKEQLQNLWPPHEMTGNEKDWIINAVTSIVGYTLSEPLGNPIDPEETYDAFHTPASDRLERSSSRTPVSTEVKPVTPGKTPSGGSGSGPVTPLYDSNSGPPDTQGIPLDKYRVIDKLGAGGMGDVWLVEHIYLGVNRALKLIKTNIADDNPSNLLRFQQEAKILAQLSKHPNAVAVHDFSIKGVHAYIEMDYLEGQTLGKWVKSRCNDQLPLDDVLWFLGEFCNVMGEAHRLKIVHRDIKPGNIMIVPDPNAERGERVKVLDFGIAKIIQDAEGDTGSMTMHTRGYLGTAHYSSPEQLGSDGDGQEHIPVDHRSDIYSIGVLLYEMISGQRPFAGNATQILYAHAHRPPPPFAERSPSVRVPREVEKVVMRCLEKLPARRPQSVQELYEMFARAVPHTVSRTVPRIPRPQTRTQPSQVSGASFDTKFAQTTRRFVSQATSLLTQLGLPRFLPRKAILRLFLGLALFSGVVSGTFVILFFPSVIEWIRNNGLRTRTVPETVRSYLESLDFRPDDKAGVTDDFWPKKIERISKSGSIPMVLDSGFYVPEGYARDPNEASAAGPPRVLVRGSDEGRFLLIEGDDFVMGAWDDPNIEFDDVEKPGHLVRLTSYYMQETEVTNKEIKDFWGNGPRDDKDIAVFWKARESFLEKNMEESAWEKRPAVGISHRLAAKYAHSVGGELPTEPQWEFAARSRGQKRPYVWPGNEREPNGKKMAHIFVQDGYYPCPVMVPATDCTDQGIRGLAGNVREWCRDVWQCYPPRPRVAEDKPLYAIRGGSYYTTPETARVTYRGAEEGKIVVRYKLKEDESSLDVGFRVVLEVVEQRLPSAGSLASRSPQEVSP